MSAQQVSLHASLRCESRERRSLLASSLLISSLLLLSVLLTADAPLGTSADDTSFLTTLPLSGHTRVRFVFNYASLPSSERLNSSTVSPPLASSFLSDVNTQLILALRDVQSEMGVSIASSPISSAVIYLTPFYATPAMSTDGVRVTVYFELMDSATLAFNSQLSYIVLRKEMSDSTSFLRTNSLFSALASVAQSCNITGILQFSSQCGDDPTPPVKDANFWSACYCGLITLICATILLGGIGFHYHRLLAPDPKKAREFNAWKQQKALVAQTQRAARDQLLGIGPSNRSSYSVPPRTNRVAQSAGGDVNLLFVSPFTAVSRDDRTPNGASAAKWRQGGTSSGWSTSSAVDVGEGRDIDTTRSMSELASPSQPGTLRQPLPSNFYPTPTPPPYRPQQNSFSAARMTPTGYDEHAFAPMSEMARFTAQGHMRNSSADVPQSSHLIMPQSRPFGFAPPPRSHAQATSFLPPPPPPPSMSPPALPPMTVRVTPPSMPEMPPGALFGQPVPAAVTHAHVARIDGDADEDDEDEEDGEDEEYDDDDEDDEEYDDTDVE